MVAQAAKYGLEFDVETLGESGHDFRIVPNAMGQVHDARVGLYRLAHRYTVPSGRPRTITLASTDANTSR
jgi:hypothetical protein